MALTPNEQQQKAIDILDGSVMLLAGPGTGKTFTVIQRIEKMLEKGSCDIIIIWIIPNNRVNRFFYVSWLLGIKNF